MTPKQAAEKLKSYGRNGDTELVHMTKGEVNSLRGLAQLAGGDLTTNPKTGQPEAFFLAALLPTLIGGVGGAMGLGAMGTAALGAGVGALMNRNDPLMGAISGGMGGFGGGQLASGLVGAGASAVNPAQLAAANAAADPIGALANSATQASAAGVAGPTGLGAFKAGLQNTMASPMHYVNQMGGGMKTLQAAGMAAAPLMHYQPKQRGGSGRSEYDGEMPEYDFNYNATGDTWRPGQGTHERTHFNPTFTRRFAEGGIASVSAGGMTGDSAAAMNYLMGGSSMPRQSAAVVPQPAEALPPSTPVADPTRGPLSGPEFLRLMMNTTVDQMGRSRSPRARMMHGLFERARTRRGFAEGGLVSLNSGDFVIPADVVSMAGGGSTDAGMKVLAKKVGAEPIRGLGDGLSDDIPAHIDGRQLARVANGEMLVRNPGPENTRKLYAMLDRVRKQATGSARQVRPVNLDKALA